MCSHMAAGPQTYDPLAFCTPEFSSSSSKLWQHWINSGGVLEGELELSQHPLCARDLCQTLTRSFQRP